MADNVPITAGVGTTISTDERTISATLQHVQRVAPIGNTAMTSGQVTVTNTATTIAAARETREEITIVNRQTVAVWVGEATVTSSSAIRLDPGDSITLRTNVLIQGITAAAYTATGDAKVQYAEVYSA